MIRQRTLTLLLISSIVLTGCSSQRKALPELGKVVGCQTIRVISTDGGVGLPCLDGKSTLHLNQIKGPLILNVWGSWCAPCKEEMPIFRSFYARAKSQVQLLGVNVEEAKRSDAINFVRRQGITWPNLIDPDGRTRGFFGMGVPVTWFIDSKGKVLYKKIGVLRNEAELIDLTSKYLHITVG